MLIINIYVHNVYYIIHTSPFGSRILLSGMSNIYVDRYCTYIFLRNDLTKECLIFMLIGIVPIFFEK